MRIRQLLYVLFFSTTLYAQPTDSITIEQWNSQALHHISNDQIDSFDIFYNKICTASKNNDDLLGWIETHRDIGRALNKKNTPDTALIYLQKSYLSSLFRQPKTDEEWEKLGWLYVYAAYIEYDKKENFEGAEKLYSKAFNILANRLNISSFKIARYVLLPLGEIYTILGDTPAAETMYKKSIQISYNEKEYYYAARALGNLSTVYRSTDETTKAIASCREGLALDISDEVAIGALNSNLAKALFDNNQSKEAIIHANTANHYFEILALDKYPAASSWVAANNTILGEFYASIEDFDAADACFEKASFILDTLYSNKYNRDYAKHYLAWGLSKRMQNDTEGALKLLQQSLQSLLPSFKENNPLVNPKVENLKAENTFQDVLLEKADIFEQLFDKNGETKYLHAALECHELVFEVEKLLRESYYYESSKLFNVTESRRRCGDAVKVALKLADKTNDLTYKKKAFEFAERSKSILLLEYFMENDAERNSAIPDYVIEKGVSLKESIVDAEEELETNSNQNAQEIQIARDSLFKLKREYETWKKNLEEKYPLYYANKYNYSTICVDEVQDELVGDGETVLEYFVSESTIYLFVFSKSDFNIIEIKKEADFEQTVINFHQSIEAFQYKKSNRDSLCQVYTTLAQTLYAQLLQPVEKLGLSSNVKIVSSGILAFLPFDALLTEEPKELCAFGEYPYALHKYNISYDYSLTLHERMKKTAPRLSGTYVGFAPNFDGKNGFSALRLNTGLIKDIAKLWKDGTPVHPDSSTVRHFQEVVDKYAIIHLATHAKANMDKGNYSFIVFANGNGGYDSLFVRDIYELRLLAEMVVLSACETAIGELHDGEGIISLARAFLQSGSRSAITTLWNINEGRSNNLMKNFYKYLAEGDSKSKALQRAKAEQINHTDFNAHPVFWAAYTPYGQMNPVVGKTNWWPYAAGGGALFSIFFLSFRRKNKNTNS